MTATDACWALAFIITGICICLGAQVVWQGFMKWLFPEPECPACMSSDFDHIPGGRWADAQLRCRQCGHSILE
jgi:hypothetical protein